MLAAVAAYEPDILLTAGHAVHNRKHLRRLASNLALEAMGTTIVTEVHYDGSGPPRRLSQHALYVVQPNGSIIRLGRQIFAKREETIGAEAWRVSLLAERASRRLVEIDGRRAFVLGCGEINAVLGRADPRFIDPVIGKAITSADIVLNPTHDRMGRAGLLDAKRRFLSQHRTARGEGVYVSCSNWNRCTESGVAQRPSGTLHTCYVNGTPIKPMFQGGADEWGYLYRHYRVG
jgi:hypothetical protein